MHAALPGRGYVSSSQLWLGALTLACNWNAVGHVNRVCTSSSRTRFCLIGNSRLVCTQRSDETNMGNEEERPKRALTRCCSWCQPWMVLSVQIEVLGLISFLGWSTLHHRSWRPDKHVQCALISAPTCVRASFVYGQPYAARVRQYLHTRKSATVHPRNESP